MRRTLTLTIPGLTAGSKLPPPLPARHPASFPRPCSWDATGDLASRLESRCWNEWLSESEFLIGELSAHPFLSSLYSHDACRGDLPQGTRPWFPWRSSRRVDVGGYWGRLRYLTALILIRVASRVGILPPARACNFCTLFFFGCSLSQEKTKKNVNPGAHFRPKAGPKVRCLPLGCPCSTGAHFFSKTLAVRTTYPPPPPPPSR